MASWLRHRKVILNNVFVSAGVLDLSYSVYLLISCSVWDVSFYSLWCIFPPPAHPPTVLVVRCLALVVCWTQTLILHCKFYPFIVSFIHDCERFSCSDYSLVHRSMTFRKYWSMMSTSLQMHCCHQLKALGRGLVSSRTAYSSVYSMCVWVV